MTANAEHSEKWMADLKRVMRDSEELLQDSTGAVGEKAREIRERLERTLQSAKATCSRLQEQAKEGAKATDKLIRANPYKAIGIAVGVGILIGVLARRR